MAGVDAEFDKDVFEPAAEIDVVYCNRNDKDGGPQKYPQLTLETLAAGIGSTKGTVSKIFNERKNGKTRYPVLEILWDSLETEDKVMAYGRSHFQQPQRKN